MDDLLKSGYMITETQTDPETGVTVTVSRETTIDDIEFDWGSKSAFVK